MTAETLKPFLSFAAAPIGGDNIMDAKQRRLRMFFTFSGIFLIILIMATLLSLTIWHSIKINQLEQEVHDLKTKIIELRKHLRFEAYDDLNDLDDFADAYKKTQADEEDDSIYLDGPETYGQQKTTDDGGGKSFADDDFDGSGGVDEYDDDYEDDYDNGNNIYNDMRRIGQLAETRSRTRRALAGVTRQGVPIMEESYLEHRRNRTNFDYGHENSVHSPRLQYKWEDSKRPRQHAQNHKFSAHHQSHHQQPELVPLMDKFGGPRGYAQESVRAPTEYVKPPPAHSNGKKFLHLIRDPREGGTRGHHVSDGIIYNDWTVKSGEQPKNFKVNAGVVTILHSGNYYVYAQISNDGHPESFVIERNQGAELSCSTSTDSCFTAGIMHLKYNDMIYVKDVSGSRSWVKDPHKTFFGLIKLD